MIIKKVLSYKNAWEYVNTNNQVELKEILNVLPKYINQCINTKDEFKRAQISEFWEKELFKMKWIVSERIFYTNSGHKININNIGPIKNNVSVTISNGHPDFLHRWLFQQSPIVCKYNIAKVPILLAPIEDFSKTQEVGFFRRFYFENYKNQLEPLAPLSHGYPFLILGYTNGSDMFDIEVSEIESDPLLKKENTVIDKCIEFPPEYYHAGINILSFFGTYIKEQYPDQKANVKIEQHENIVRLIIETNDGESQTIEKALDEYQLVISGQRAPECVTQNEKLILELKNELRIAKYRIESQQDIIQMQGSRIDKFMDIIGAGLAVTQPVHIDFNPTISLSNSVCINQNISSAISDLSKLKEILPQKDDIQLQIKDLENSLDNIESELNPDVVRKSSTMSKFRKFIDKAFDKESDLSKTISTIEKGWDIFKDLAGKYNSIAEWCGLPQVPKKFTK